MKKAVPETAHEFDENGNLVTRDDLTDEQKVVAEGLVLFQSGLSGNHPSDVAAQYVEPDAPPVIEEEPEGGETAYDRSAREKRNEAMAQAHDKLRQQYQTEEEAVDDENPETDEKEANVDPAFGIRPSPDAPDANRRSRRNR